MSILHIIFISTNDLGLLNSRIQVRHRLGGHFIRPDIVRERYLAGLNLLGHYADRPDKLQLYDNSTSIELIAEISKGKVLSKRENLPEWVTRHLGPIFEVTLKPEIKLQDLDSVDEVRERYRLSTELRREASQSDDSDISESESKGRRRRR
jgi:hypothetical protein